MRLKIDVLLLAFLFCIVFTSAIEVNYDIIATGVNSTNSSCIESKNIIEDCEVNCSFSIPEFSISEIFSYSLNYSSAEYNLYFNSTKSNDTTDKSDTIIAEILATETAEESIIPNISIEEPVAIITEKICNQAQCDEGCVKCSDNQCHTPEFVCNEKVAIEKVLPYEIAIGQSQLNILLRNTGNVDLYNIFAEITGDGVKTISTVAIEKLIAGDKDYTFVKINSSTPGTIDIVIKLYINNTLKDKIINQITVLEEKKVEADTGINIEELSASLAKLKEDYKTIDQEYRAKEEAGFSVGDIYDRLKEARNYITETESAFYQGNYKKASADIQVISGELEDIKEKVTLAKKIGEKINDKIRNNLIYIGSMAGAIISIFGAFNLIKGHINKDKIAGLKKIIPKGKESKEEQPKK